MKANYKFLEHTADELFVAEASTLGELFEQCGLAVEEIQVDLKQFSNEEKREITGENENIEYLLFDFLDDLLFHKDSERMIFSKFDCHVTEENGKYKLTCTAYGEKISDKHEQKVDIKAITMHMFEVKKTDEGWFAKVLVDI